MRELKPVERKENYKYTVYFYNDCEEIESSVPASRQGMIQSYTDWALAYGGNAIMILHPDKSTLKIHIKKDNMVWVASYDKDGDCTSTTNPFYIVGMKIFDLYGETEVEEWDCENVQSILLA